MQSHHRLANTVRINHGPSKWYILLEHLVYYSCYEPMLHVKVIPVWTIAFLIYWPFKWWNWLSITICQSVKSKVVCKYLWFENLQWKFPSTALTWLICTLEQEKSVSLENEDVSSLSLKLECRPTHQERKERKKREGKRNKHCQLNSPITSLPESLGELFKADLINLASSWMFHF